MKKVVLGCLGVLVVASIGVVVAGYLFVYRPMKSYVTSFAELGEIPKIERQVANQAQFTAPADGALTADQVDRYVKVARSVHEQLGARAKELDGKYQTLNRTDRQPSITDMMGALKDMSGLLVEAKRAQVAALNAQHFSLAEYDWTRRSIYTAMGVPMAVDFTEIVKQAQSGGQPTGQSLTEPKTGEVPEANKALVEPHRKFLEEHAALAFFGL